MRGPIAALMLLALSSSRAGFPCALCEAGYDSCGFCLNRIAHTECPASDALDVMANCTEVAVGKMCEADGECGTSTVLNNCENMNWEGFTNNDVYRRVACDDVVPTCAECPAGSACGRCLKPVPFSECPGAVESTIGLDDLKALPTCDLVEEGELCEADGECGTEDSTNNCVYSSRLALGGDPPQGGGGGGGVVVVLVLLLLLGVAGVAIYLQREHPFVRPKLEACGALCTAARDQLVKLKAAHAAPARSRTAPVPDTPMVASLTALPLTAPSAPAMLSAEVTPAAAAADARRSLAANDSAAEPLRIGLVTADHLQQGSLPPAAEQPLPPL